MLIIDSCGWLDLKLLQYSVGMNAYTALNLTKLDILDSKQLPYFTVPFSNSFGVPRIELG